MALDLQKATYKVRNRIQKMAQTILAAAAGQRRNLYGIGRAVPIRLS